MLKWGSVGFVFRLMHPTARWLDRGKGPNVTTRWAIHVRSSRPLTLVDYYPVTLWHLVHRTTSLAIIYVFICPVAHELSDSDHRGKGPKVRWT